MNDQRCSSKLVDPYGTDIYMFTIISDFDRIFPIKCTAKIIKILKNELKISCGYMTHSYIYDACSK